MRIVLNGIPMVGRPTGVGQYGLALLEALHSAAKQDGVTELGVFDGSRIRAADDFLSGSRRIVPWRRKLIPLARYVAPQTRMLRDFWERRRLKREISRSGWRIYHETNFVVPELATPLVTTIHDMSYVRYPHFFPRDRVKWLQEGLKRTVRKVAAILVDSEFTRGELLEVFPHVSPDKIHVTLLGVNYERFADPANLEKSIELRQRLRLPRQFALYLGTLEPRKNLQGLIQAYNLLPADLQQEFPLVVAGARGRRQDYFRAELDALRRRGLLHEVGYVAQEDVPALLTAAEVFCFPSLYEGFGLPPLEAAAAGTAVLSSNAASLPEVMGDAAAYVDPQNVEAIAVGLRTIFEDVELRRTLRTAGRRRARQFSWDRCARQTLDVYRRAA